MNESMIDNNTPNKDLLDAFIAKCSAYPAEDQAKIRHALTYAAERHKDQKRKSGEPYIVHPIAVAEILIELNMDADSICGGLLHDIIEDTGTTADELTEEFGSDVSALVQGVTKIKAIQSNTRTLAEAETIRKMFIAMSRNIPIIIIKLCDRLHNMRTLEYMDPERAKVKANECLDIYAPLADRLGIAWMKAELEDLSLKTLKPETFKYIQDYVHSKGDDSREYIEEVKRRISDACADAGIKGITISSRLKHAYSIYMKMKKRRKEIEEIFDILGIRVICSTVPECYTLIGVIHSVWPPMEGRFKDYIAMPKANNYQSLHTTIITESGTILEIQIRTYEMDKIAEYGVASHWVYKADSGSEAASSWTNMDKEQLSRIATKLKKWNTEVERSESFMDDIRQELLKDTIYVFTPKGKAVELPKGSTALDFAYLIHTEVGNHTVSAKANGSIISLSEPLKNTQVIEIITQRNAHPRISWLKYATTTSARRKIRAWLNKNDENIIIERNIIANRREVEEAQKANHAERAANELRDDDIIRSISDRSRKGISVGSAKNIMIQMAQCCSPMPGDDIVGYISRGRGIIVHRADCHNLAHMPEIEKRKINVQWDSSETTVSRRFIVTSRRTANLFSEIEGALKGTTGHLIAGSLSDGDDGGLTGTFTIECDKEETFKSLLKKIRSTPNVISIRQD